MTILKPLGYAAALSVTTVFGLTAATQYVAWQLNFDAALGQPFGYLGRIPWYSPWGIIDWYRWRDQLAIIDTGLFLGLTCIVIPLAILIRLVRPKRQTLGRQIWATVADIKRAGLLRRKPSGTILGKLSNGRLLSYDGDEHQMVVGASRSGKTAGFVIPTLLTWRGSVVIFDPKRELYAITARFRQQFSHAFYLDFTDPNSACFNPLVEIRIGTVHEVADVQNIVAILVDPGGSKDSLDYWDKDSSELLLGVILFVLHGDDDSRKSLAAIRQLLLDLPALLKAMTASEHAEVRRIGNSFEQMPPKQLYGVKATASTALILYADPLVAEKTSRSDFRIADLVCLDNPRSLYLQLPPSDANRLRPLSRLILSQIVTLMMENLSDVFGEKKKHKLMMMIDEFATLGRLDCFTSWIRVMASYGLRAVLILQSDRDLADTYGPYNTISENCPVQVLFPTSDDSTLRRISTAIGNDDENRESRTYPRWFSPGKSSKSVSERRRPVLEPAEIRSMPKDEQFILITTCKPVRCKKIRWWMDKPFRSRGINTFEGSAAPPQHPAILKMAQAARPEAVPLVEQETQEPDKTAIATAAIAPVERETQPTDEIPTVSGSPIPQHQDNPLAAVGDRIGWTKTETAQYLFPAEDPHTVLRWMRGARRLPDEHRPFITHLLETVANRSESKTDLQAWLLSVDADGVSIIERLRNGEVIEVAT